VTQIDKLNSDVACRCEQETSSDSSLSVTKDIEEKSGSSHSNELFNGDILNSSKKCCKEHETQENSTTLKWPKELARVKLLGQKWNK